MRGVGAAHEARRRELLDAALRAVEQGGVDALTFRGVAAEAGVSLGRVQHYFSSRTDLLRATYAHIQEVTRQRITEEVAAEGDGASGQAVVRAVLQALVPATPSRQAHLRVAQMFDIVAMGDVTMLRELRTGHAELVDFLAVQLDRARRGGEAAQSLDPARAAVALLALAEGLGGLVLIGYLPAPQAQDLLDEQLKRVLGEDR